MQRHGVVIGDVVNCESLPYLGKKGVVIGFLVAHPDNDEVHLLRAGDRVTKHDAWPPGGSLTAEKISSLVRKHSRR